MRRAIRVTTVCTVACLFCAWATAAEQEPPQEDAPAKPAAAAAEPAKPEAAEPAEKEAPKSEAPKEPPADAKPPATKPKALDEAAEAAIADWVKKMGSRAEAKGDVLTIGDICEVKHYEQDKLQGFGMVLDLEAALEGPELATETTAEETAAADEARLTELLSLLNAPVTEGAAQPAVPDALRGPDVLTLVAVTATVPPEGAQEGDRIDCEIHALGGETVDEGFLLVTQLSLPGPKMDAPAGLAAGPIVEESSYRAGGAKVAGGCLMQADVCDQFVKDEKITLILDEEHAEFPIAQDLVDLVNAEMGVAMNQPLAKALNRFMVEVTVPPPFADDPVAFVTLVLRLQTQIPSPDDEEETPATRRFRTLPGTR